MINQFCHSSSELLTSLNATDERNGVMSKSLSTSLIVRGILAFGVGIIAVAWPQVTVFALVILFAMLAFIAAGQEATWAFSSTTARPVIRHLLLGLIDAAAGVVALLWPAPTALVLVLIVASWAVVTGLFEFFAGFRRGELAGSRAQLLLGGLVSIAFGVVLFARPDMGAITLALLFGMFNLIYGAWQFILGIELRQTGNAAHSAAEMSTPPRNTSQPRVGTTAA
jgi:uncharacterized membrane protein HdeD (DUF308 family)